MGLSLRPEHLKRYRDIAGLLLKYGRSDLVTRAGLEDALDGEQSTSDRPPAEAERLADDLERLGPTYIKLGQLRSTRPDLLPAPYAEALSRLQDRVEPFGFDQVEEILRPELGIRISKAFSSFDATPLASASLGQVHRATLRDGSMVAVKVPRPDIREQIVGDLEALSEIAAFVDTHTEAGKRYGFDRLIGEFRGSVLRELDYRLGYHGLAILFFLAAAGGGLALVVIILVSDVSARR